MRDQAPELVAEKFLHDQGQGICRPIPSDLCDYALRSHSVMNWRLAARETTKNGVALYYRVQTQDSLRKFLGQAAVGVDNLADGWHVTSYAAVY